MAHGNAHEAEFDSQHRPITAALCEDRPIIFQDIAQAAGLTSWHHKAGTPEKRLILEAKGPGVCLLDYDNDGWLDIYLVNGSTYEALDGKATPPHAVLFHNNHNGTFTDVTKKPACPTTAGIWVRGWRLQQRRLAGPVCNQLRKEPPIP